MTDTKLSIKAAPGIYLISLIEEKSKVNFGQTTEKQILKGKIIDVGENRDHDDGGKMIATLQKGDIVWFFSYVQGADYLEIDKVRYYCTLFHDIRAYAEK